MKYIKTYEGQRKPKVGDYVIMKAIRQNDELRDYLEKHPGKILACDKYGILVQYFNLPENIKNIGRFDTNGTKGFRPLGFVRFATQEEIKDLNFKKEINWSDEKYNL